MYTYIYISICQNEYNIYIYLMYMINIYTQHRSTSGFSQEKTEMARQEEPAPVPSCTEDTSLNKILKPPVNHLFMHEFTIVYQCFTQSFCDLFLFQKLRFFDVWSVEIWRNSLVCINRLGLLSNRRDWWRRGLEKWRSQDADLEVMVQSIYRCHSMSM